MENPNDWARLQCAIDIAHEAHAGQTDKAGEPYIYHVLRVGMSLLPDVDAAVVGLLHDVIEDSPGPPNFRRPILEIGYHTWEAILDLTRSPMQLYDDYIACVNRSELARKVKLADLRDNQDLDRQKRAIANGADPDKIRELQVRYAKAIIDLETGPL